MMVYFLAGFFIFVLGICIGSFINCAIYRLEQKKSLAGRSFCPHCKHTLRLLDLVPVFSFLFLRGKCRYCGKKISIQYPLVELVTGIIFLLIFNSQFSILNNLTPAGGFPVGFFLIFNLLFSFYIAGVLIIIFVYDLKHYLIPDKILFPAIAIAFVYRLFLSFALMPIYLLAVLIAAGFFLFIFLISRGRWMGFGDVKLAVLMGLLLGAMNVLAALFLAFFFGAIIGLILMFFKNKSLKSEIPFGPFLIAGTFIAMLWGPQIIQWYTHLFLF